MKHRKKILAAALAGCLLLGLLLFAGLPKLSVSADGLTNQGLTAWDFESGTIDALGTPQSVDTDGYYAAGVSIVAGGANNSDYAMLISGAGNGNGQTIFGLTPNTAYRLSYWAKLLYCGSGAYPNVGVKNYNGNAYQAIDSYTSEWAEYTLEFTTGANATSALLYTWIFGSGNAELLVDEFTLLEKNHVHSYVNGTCSCGAVDANPDTVSALTAKYLNYDYRSAELEIYYLTSELSGFSSYQLRVNAQRYDTAAGTYKTVCTNLFPSEQAVDGQYTVFRYPISDLVYLNEDLQFCLVCNRLNGAYCKSAAQTCNAAQLLADRLNTHAVANGQTDTALALREYLANLLVYAAETQAGAGYPAQLRCDTLLTAEQRGWTTRQTAAAAQRETDTTVSYGAYEQARRAGDRRNTVYPNTAYNGAAADGNFFLLYNTLGYEQTGTKKAFIRSVTNVAPSLTGEGEWALINSDNELVAKGAVVYKGFSYGLQLWEADFTDVDTAGTCHLYVTLCDRFGAIAYRETSSEFQIAKNLYSENVLLGLTIDNAKARQAPSDVGGGYYDCNTTMGEAYSHGVFLNGLVQTYVLNYNTLTYAERTDLIAAAQRAFDYLELLHDDSTGEFINSDPRRYNADVNQGMHNTFEALYGYAAYLCYFKDTDPTRAGNDNYRRAVRSLEYLQSNYPTDSWYPYREYLIPVCYYLYKYSGSSAWLTMGSNLIENELSSFNLRTMYRSGARSIPLFEGVYLFLSDSSINLPRRAAWLSALNSIKNTYYLGIDEKNAMDLLPISTYENAAAEWDNMWQLPSGEYEQNWQLTTARATNAMDACFLGMLTGDTSLEPIATASLGYIMGLNPGFSGSLVTNPTSTRAMSAGALVQNLNARRSTGWYYWRFTPLNNTFLSVMNGFRIVDGQYCFENSDLDDWTYGETFLRHDGAFAYAFSVYERYLSMTP